MANRSVAAWRRWRGGVHPYWLLAIVGIVTVTALAGFRHLVRERDEARFRTATAAVEGTLRTRIDAYVSILLATRGYFSASHGQVDAKSFRAFVSDLELEQRYPGIQGVGFSRRLQRSELQTVVAETERGGQEPFHVWPQTPRDEYHAVLFLEPLDRRNVTALGFDMYTDPVRREAMARARDTGKPAASGRVTLVQEIDPQKQSGFLIYVPIYADGSAPQTVGERRDALVGFVYSPFRVDDLVQGSFGWQMAPSVAFDLYDGTEPRRAARMHHGLTGTRDAQHSALRRMEVAGRPWTLHVESTEAFAATSSVRFAPYMIGIALLANLAFWLLARSQVRARREQAMAAERLAILADTSKRLPEAQLDVSRVLKTICEEVAHRVGESCTINLVNETGTHLELADTSHVNAEEERDIREVLSTAKVPMGQTSIGKVAATGVAIHVPVVDQRALLATMPPRYREHLERFPLASLVVVPLRIGDRVTGTITAGRGPKLAPFTVDDQRLLQDIADRAAFAIENARLATRLQRSIRDAQQAVRIRDEFLSIAGHELKTPVAALQLQLEGLLRQAERGALGAVPPRVVERLEKAQGHVERLEMLIAGLLDVAKIAAGKLVLQHEEVELASLLGEVTERFSEPLSRAGCDVSIRAAEPVVGCWDRLRLDQVFTNLVSNALKYGPGKPIEITIDRQGDRARVAVRDRGIGVSPDDRRRIFGRFERAVSDRHYGGLGLGLWISQEIVEAFGGRIELESELGRGSTFTVELPLDMKAA